MVNRVCVEQLVLFQQKIIFPKLIRPLNDPFEILLYPEVIRSVLLKMSRIGVILLYTVVIVAVLVHVFLYPVDLAFVDVNHAVQGKNVIVTGSSMGIGRSLAFKFAENGAKNIVIVSRSAERLEKVKSEIIAVYPSVRIHVIARDLSSEENCKTLIEESLSLIGTLDYLVLNHITSSRYGLWFSNSNGETKDNSFFDDILHTNTFSYVWLANHAMKYLIKSSGKIAVVSSLAGHVGTPFTAAYAASKHALHGFFYAMRNELKIMGVNNVGITLCAIGATDTEGARDVKEKLTSVQWDSADDAAVAIIKGMVTEKRDIYHPHHKIYPTVIIYALYPEAIDSILRNVM